MLGWDITNQKNKSTSEREALVEESLKENKSTNIKKPDYTFRLFSERKFFLEAKKPSVDISKDIESAKQIRRYGFTAKLKISVLSNFEHLVIYDTSSIVSEEDKVSDYRVSIYHYTEYEENFEEIQKLLGRDSVYSGNFDDKWVHIEALTLLSRHLHQVIPTGLRVLKYQVLYCAFVLPSVMAKLSCLHYTRITIPREVAKSQIFGMVGASI